VSDRRLSPHIGSYLSKKLSGFTRLAQSDQDALTKLSNQRIRTLGPRRNFVEQGETQTVAYLIQQGWARGYTNLGNGDRQVTAFFLPGDVCHLDLLLPSRMNYSVGSITDLVISEVTPAAFETLAASHPELARAFRWEMLSSSAIQREWLINVARRSALERVAHLICELFLRLRRVGLTKGHGCEWPPTQSDLADALGLTGIHMNRMLQQLRSEELIILKNRHLTIPDLEALQRVAGFDASYLHLPTEAEVRPPGVTHATEPRIIKIRR
jgi:CRP-like cAMP-binding protein